MLKADCRASKADHIIAATGILERQNFNRKGARSMTSMYLCAEKWGACIESWIWK